MGGQCSIDWFTKMNVWGHHHTPQHTIPRSHWLITRNEHILKDYVTERFVKPGLSQLQY